jgi:predicted O-methyltransferase YrrM
MSDAAAGGAPGNTHTYQEFFAQFGASCRRKHLNPGKLRLWIQDVRVRLAGKTPKPRVALRTYPLPARSSLPPKFIRLDPWEMDYLFTIASIAKVGILETGRFNGGSVFLMSWANRAVPIWSIDLAPRDDELLRQFLDGHGIGRNVRLIVGDSQHQRDPRVTGFDVLFVDGDHSYQGCTNDLENWWPLLATGGHVVLHDSYHGNEVQRAAIDFVKSHPSEIVQTPFINSLHWHNPCGSLAHFRKL